MLGDCASVLAVLAEGVEARHLARAVCQLRTGRPGEVAAELAPVTGPLAGYARLLAARAAHATGDDARATALLADLVLPGAAGTEVKHLRATLRGDVEGLLSLRDTELGPQAAVEAAALVTQRDPRWARQILQQAFLDARPGGWDERAREGLLALGVDPLADPAVRSARLAALNRAHRVEDARTLVDAAPLPTTPTGWKALGDVRYAARDYPGALAAWREVFGPPETATGTAADLFQYALCHARAGDYDTAALVYRRVMATAPTSGEAEFASFKLGYMEYDRDRCDAAVPLFDAHREAFPASKRLDEALWWTARCAERAGDAASAEAAWALLAKARPRSSLVPGAAYWQARHRGGEAEAAGLRHVLDTWPESAYAWLAAERLGMVFPERAPVALPGFPEAQRARPEVVRFEALAAVGLRAWARDELASVSAEPLVRGAALLRIGEVAPARALACPLAGRPGQGGNAVAQQICWPRVEGDIVASAAGIVPESVVFGVMLSESDLDPGVSSSVGARGLMQLMPSVAAGLHERLFPGRAFDADDLFVGPYNALLGTTELADRARSLDGLLAPSSLPAVIASYNGGEEAVRRWAASVNEDDAFVEAIGFVETRGYVKRVLGSAMAWRLVWGDRPDPGPR